MTAHESIDQSAFTDDMLDELGFYGLTPRQRAETVQQLNEALNERVGQVLTVSIDNDTLDEFGCFMDQDVSRMRAWLDLHVPSYEAQDTFRAFLGPDYRYTEQEALAEFGRLAWLQLYCPDYPSIVRREARCMREEVKEQNRSARAQEAQPTRRAQGPDYSDPTVQFVASIIDEKNIPGMTPYSRDMMVQDLMKRLLNLIDRAAINSLTNSQLDELSTWLDRNGSTATSNEAQRFISRFIPPERGQQIALDVMLAFRKEHLGY